MRGPCTPSTRLSSMSLVAEGPLIQVVRAGRVEEGDGVGHVGHHLVRAHDADVQVGHQGQRPAALAGAVGRARWCRWRRCPTVAAVTTASRPSRSSGGQPVVGYGAGDVPRQPVGDHDPGVRRQGLGDPGLDLVLAPQRTTTAR